MQRDLYSAFLVFCCLANILDIRQVQKAWPSAEPLLRQAMSRSSQSASGKAPCFPQGLNTLRADRLSEKVIPQCEVADAVAKARAAESSGMKLLEPPGLAMGRFRSGVVKKKKDGLRLLKTRRCGVRKRVDTANRSRFLTEFGFQRLVSKESLRSRWEELR